MADWYSYDPDFSDKKLFCERCGSLLTQVIFKHERYDMETGKQFETCVYTCPNKTKRRDKHTKVSYDKFIACYAY